MGLRCWEMGSFFFFTAWWNKHTIISQQKHNLLKLRICLRSLPRVQSVYTLKHSKNLNHILCWLSRLEELEQILLKDSRSDYSLRFYFHPSCLSCFIRRPALCWECLRRTRRPSPTTALSCIRPCRGFTTPRYVHDSLAMQSGQED